MLLLLEPPKVSSTPEGSCAVVHFEGFRFLVVHNNQFLCAKLFELCRSNVNNMVIHYTKAVALVPLANPHMYISIDSSRCKAFVQLCRCYCTPALQVRCIVSCTFRTFLHPRPGSKCNSRDPTAKLFVHAAIMPQHALSVKPYFDSRNA